MLIFTSKPFARHSMQTYAFFATKLLVCPLTRSWEPRPRPEHEPGLALQTAANRKRRAVYPELVAARRCKPVVLGIEGGGRIGQEALGFVRQLANAKARGVPARLRAAARQVHIHRWTGMLAVAAQRAFAMSLLELSLATADECDGAEPPLAEVLASCPAAYPRRGGRERQEAWKPRVGEPDGTIICRRKKVREKKNVSLQHRLWYLDAVVSLVACYAAGHRKIFKGNLHKLDVTFRRLLRSVFNTKPALKAAHISSKRYDASVLVLANNNKSSANRRSSNLSRPSSMSTPRCSTWARQFARATCRTAQKSRRLSTQPCRTPPLIGNSRLDLEAS